MNIQLPPDELLKIKTILQQFENLKQAKIFGSRALGRARPGSDIDIALVGSELSLSDLLKISQALEDLFLPYKIDLLIYTEIQNKDLIAHIDNFGLDILD